MTSRLLSIAEAAAELGVQPHVLRFWEKQFRQIRPIKTSRGWRIYRPEDVALLGRIKSLLYRDGYTIIGLRRLLDSENGRVPGFGTVAESGRGAPEVARQLAPVRPPEPSGHQDLASTLEELRSALAELHGTLRTC